MIEKKLPIFKIIALYSLNLICASSTFWLFVSPLSVTKSHVFERSFLFCLVLRICRGKQSSTYYLAHIMKKVECQGFSKMCGLITPESSFFGIGQQRHYSQWQFPACILNWSLFLPFFSNFQELPQKFCCSERTCLHWVSLFLLFKNN